MYDNNLNFKNNKFIFRSYTSFPSCNLLFLPTRCSSIETQLSLYVLTLFFSV